MDAWAGVTVRDFFVCACVRSAIELYMGAVVERVHFATGSWTIGCLVLGVTLGGGARFTIGSSVLGAGRWCIGNVCTLGCGKGGVGGTGGLGTLGDRRRGSIF